MKKIKWLNLHGHQECSPRLGYKNDSRLENKGKPLKNLTSVCCQEVYDIAWEAEKQMMKVWNEWGKANRLPHFYEFSAIWEWKEIKKPFLECPGLAEIVFNAQNQIVAFYKKHLGRKPEENEMVGAYYQCQIDPNFKHIYGLKVGTKEYNEKNWDRRSRKDAFDFVQMIEIGKCVVCGKPVYTWNEHETLEDAGEIKMSFGYGSQRDMDIGKGYIHDLCSAKLDQRIFKQRLDWEDPYCSIKIRESERAKKIIYRKRGFKK